MEHPDPASAGDTRDPTRSGGSIAVLVLGFNDSKWLPRCLSSVLATKDDDFVVYFVDNASSDGSAEFVAATFPQVRVVRNTTNLGFAAGNNEGIRVAVREGAEFIVLLNTDTWVEENWLTELRGVFAADPTIGVVTAMIRNYEDDRFDRNFLQILAATPAFIQDAWDGRVRPWYHTDTGSGAALMARRSFYEAVGVIDPVFFMYFEEIDLIRRARYLGYRAAFSTKAVVHHHNHLETPTAGRPTKTRFERGYMIYTLKNQFDPLPKCVIKFLLEVVSRPVGAAFKGQWKRMLTLLRTDLELVLRSPAIVWRRHLEMHAPGRLPEMRWLRTRPGQGDG